jgi:DNA-binding NtrC family response regulator
MCLWLVSPRPRETRTYSLLEGVEIGRSAAISLADGRLSRTHCAIRPAKQRHRIQDLKSRNGTFVNRRRIDETLLTAGDVIRVGDAVFVYSAAKAAPCAHPTEIVGESAAIGEVLLTLERLGASDIVVLLEGDTGTGKELAAHALHRFSGRRGPFVATNVGAMPDALFESELFGHVRGAFTGATSDREGLAASADQGTLFLDEIGELSPALQIKLLRFLETRHVRPVGGTREVKVNVRVVAATNVRLDEAVHARRFRTDLYARLAEARLRLPRLRAHIEDLPLLAEHFCATESSRPMPAWTADFAEALCLHEWAMNVRELRALVRRLALIHPEAKAWTLDLLPTEITAPLTAKDTVAPPAAAASALDETALRVLLTTFEGNVRRAAAAAGLERTRFYRRLRELGLRPEDFRGGARHHREPAS